MNASLPTVSFGFSESPNLMIAGDCRADFANKAVRHVARQLQAEGARYYRKTDVLVVLPGEPLAEDMGLMLGLDVSADHADMVDPIGATLRANATWKRCVVDNPSSPYKRFVTEAAAQRAERYADAWAACMA